MLHRYVLLLLGALFLVQGKADACTIIPPSFCTNANFDTTELVVKAKVIAHINSGVRLRILEIWRGRESRSEITVWDRESWDCNGLLFSGDAKMLFPLNATVWVSLQKVDMPNNNWEQTGDYRTPFLIGQEWHPVLTQQGTFVSGAIENGNRGSMPVALWLIKLKSCVNGVHAQPRYPASQALRFDPVRGILQVADSMDENTEIAIFNMAGQSVMAGRPARGEISLHSLSPGIYVVRLRGEGFAEARKIMLM